MPQLKELIKTLEKTSPRDTHNIAGYIEENKFWYYVSSSAHLPAAVSVLDVVGKKKGMIFTNLKKDHWLYTYTGTAGGESEKALAYIDDSDATAQEMEAMGGRMFVRVVAGEGADKAPLGGGLYAAAQGLVKDPVFYKKGEKVHTKEKGLHRALRYYMLAAYAVLGKCATAEYDQGNYIAALMVDDTGKILSYGVNSGWFHHGEVNMLLNYFKSNSSAAQFPAKTIIFSTLTPCLQCSKYLQASRPADSVIFMGQKDTGERGKEGEKYGKYLDAVTDPVSNRVATPVMKLVETGTKVQTNAWTKQQTVVPKTELQQVGETVRHYEVHTSLTGQMKSGATVAEQIGENCTAILTQSMSTLTRKVSKERPEGEERLDRGIKIAVLGYLNTWISGLSVKTRQI